jgi:acyl-coenzyme A thioesterase 9
LLTFVWTANTHNPLKDDIAMIANFKFVARDSETKKAALVNQLVPESEEEKQLYQEAEARDEYRKQHRKQHEDILGNQNAEYDHEKLKELLLEVHDNLPLVLFTASFVV